MITVIVYKRKNGDWYTGEFRQCISGEPIVAGAVYKDKTRHEYITVAKGYIGSFQSVRMTPKYFNPVGDPNTHKKTSDPNISDHPSCSDMPHSGNPIQAIEYLGDDDRCWRGHFTKCNIGDQIHQGAIYRSGEEGDFFQGKAFIGHYYAKGMDQHWNNVDTTRTLVSNRKNRRPAGILSPIQPATIAGHKEQEILIYVTPYNVPTSSQYVQSGVFRKCIEGEEVKVGAVFAPTAYRNSKVKFCVSGSGGHLLQWKESQGGIQYWNPVGNLGHHTYLGRLLDYEKHEDKVDRPITTIHYTRKRDGKLCSGAFRKCIVGETVLLGAVFTFDEKSKASWSETCQGDGTLKQLPTEGETNKFSVQYWNPVGDLSEHRLVDYEKTEEGRPTTTIQYVKNAVVYSGTFRKCIEGETVLPGAVYTFDVKSKSPWSVTISKGKMVQLRVGGPSNNIQYYNPIVGGNPHRKIGPLKEVESSILATEHHLVMPGRLYKVFDWEEKFLYGRGKTQYNKQEKKGSNMYIKVAILYTPDQKPGEAEPREQELVPSKEVVADDRDSAIALVAAANAEKINKVAPSSRLRVLVSSNDPHWQER